MDTKRLTTHPHLSKRLKTIAAKTYLFQQGQTAHTMFVIIKGTLRLLSEDDGGSHWVALVQPGELLGQRVFFDPDPHLRKFSAQALTEVTFIEVGQPEVRAILHNDPELLLEIFRGVVETSSLQLERANKLIRILKSSDNRRRLLECVAYLCRTVGIKSKSGTHLFHLTDTLKFWLDVSVEEIQSQLNELAKRQVIQSLGGEEFLIPDEQRLALEVHNLAQAA